VTYLLDVNVLIALIDPGHVSHEAAHSWFSREGRYAWATCPITQNGVIRIVGDRRYPNSPGTPSAVAVIMRRIVDLPGHVFWADDISLIGGRVDCTRLLTAGQVTDSYLIALALSKDGRLATFDRRISTAAIETGAAAVHQIEG
jgi:toxin-antitoxin system PIN domain toxin